MRQCRAATRASFSSRLRPGRYHGRARSARQACAKFAQQAERLRLLVGGQGRQQAPADVFGLHAAGCQCLLASGGQRELAAVAEAGTPDAVSRRIAAEQKRSGPAIKVAGIEAEWSVRPSAVRGEQSL